MRVLPLFETDFFKEQPLKWSRETVSETPVVIIETWSFSLRSESLPTLLGSWPVVLNTQQVSSSSSARSPSARGSDARRRREPPSARALCELRHSCTRDQKKTRKRARVGDRIFL